jgi:hypothetical protein
MRKIKGEDFSDFSFFTGLRLFPYEQARPSSPLPTIPRGAPLAESTDSLPVPRFGPVF